jgi:hypothetical protein
VYTEELESIRHSDEPTLPRLHSGRSIVDARRTDRASIAANSVNGSQAADSDDELDGPRKKRKLTAADFPWYEADNRSLLALPQAASKPANAWKSTFRTSQAAGTRSKSPLELPVMSPSLNGNEFLEVRPSTSTTSSLLSPPHYS